MIKVNHPHPAGTQSGIAVFLAFAARVLFAFCVFHSSLAVISTAQTRADNRRLFWTGSSGSVWDNSSASWMTTGSFLAYAHTGGEVWLTNNPATGEAITADPGITFVGGDVAIFDSWSDTGFTWTGSSWSAPSLGNVIGTTRTITIADGGVTASDVIVYAGTPSYEGTNFVNDFVFTGGAITADPSYVAPDSIQLTGTGVGLAANSVRPTGSLIKLGEGRLTLSNTAANHFAGGIHLMEGSLSITDNRALGDNCIIMNYIVNAGGVDGTYGNFIGEKLLALIQRPGVTSNGNVVPAVVLDSSGRLFTNGLSGNPTLHIAASAAGIDITGDIYISNRIVTFDIEGDTTISGRIVGGVNSYGANAGTIIKTGPGTLTITGTRNWFYGSSKNYNQINEGRVVLTSPHALGSGATTIDAGAVLEFRGVSGTMRQAFVGGGKIEITQGSDLTFNWRNGTLDDFDGMSGNGSWHPAMNEIATIIVSGQSRFSAIASGTYSSVLGGATVYVSVIEGSALVIGREGLSARGSGATGIPMTYAILANRIDLSGGSTLVLNPNAYLSTGALVVTDTTTCSIAFSASGVSRLRWQEGINPNDITTDVNAAASARYIVPNGMELIVNEIPVPVSPNESIPADNSSSGWCREFVIVNQGANPLKDIAMTLTAIDAIHDTLSSRLVDELVDPVTIHTPAKGRKWVNAAWARYITSDLDYDAESATTPGIEGRINGVVAGLDGILPGWLILGFHGGIAENEIDSTNDTSLSSKQKFLGLHAAQRFGKFYLSFAADTGRVTTDSFRHEADNFVRGKWDTAYYSGSVQFGGTFESWAKIMLKPYVGLRYSKIKITNYYERGASPLVVDNFNDTSAQAVYGVALSRKFVVFKRDLALDFSLARKHIIAAPRATLGTYYFDSPNTPVTLRRGDYYDDPLAIGVSARAALSRHTLAGVAFDYETASSHDRTTCSVLVAYTW